MSIEGIVIRAKDWASVSRHLDACMPEEGCGLLAGNRGSVELVLPIENAAHSPVRFVMDPRGLVAGIVSLEDAGLELLGVFHSHPAGPFGVSDTDIREWMYPEAAIVVCVLREGRWVGRAYRVEGGGMREIRLTISGS